MYFDPISQTRKMLVVCEVVPFLKFSHIIILITISKTASALHYTHTDAVYQTGGETNQTYTECILIIEQYCHTHKLINNNILYHYYILPFFMSVTFSDHAYSHS